MILHEKNYQPNWVVAAEAPLLDTSEDYKSCPASGRHPDDHDPRPWLCTLRPEHNGPHVAHLYYGEVAAVWTDD